MERERRRWRKIHHLHLRSIVGRLVSADRCTFLPLQFAISHRGPSAALFNMPHGPLHTRLEKRPRRPQPYTHDHSTSAVRCNSSVLLCRGALGTRTRAATATHHPHHGRPGYAAKQSNTHALDNLSHCILGWLHLADFITLISCCRANCVSLRPFTSISSTTPSHHDEYSHPFASHPPAARRHHRSRAVPRSLHGLSIAPADPARSACRCGRNDQSNLLIAQVARRRATGTSQDVKKHCSPWTGNKSPQFAVFADDAVPTVPTKRLLALQMQVPCYAPNLA